MSKRLISLVISILVILQSFSNPIAVKAAFVPDENKMIKNISVKSPGDEELLSFDETQLTYSIAVSNEVEAVTVSYTIGYLDGLTPDEQITLEPTALNTGDNTIVIPGYSSEDYMITVAREEFISMGLLSSSSIQGVSSVLPSIQVSLDSAQQTFTILGNSIVVNGNEQIVFAVWSSIDGQDDLLWYPGTKMNDTTWSASVNIKNHKNSTGTYIIHAYASSENGNRLIADSSVVVQDITSSGVSISLQDNVNGTFQVNAADVTSPAGITNVVAAVWSTVNGQDDLKWYTLTKNGNNYYADIDTGNHDYVKGNYYAHVYAYDARGVSKLIGGQIVSVQNSNANIQLVLTPDSTQANVAVQLQNGKYGSDISSVVFAVWGNTNGQNDLKWYTATKSGTNTWNSSFAIKNHKYETGAYNIHTYTVNKKGVMTLVKAGVVSVSGLNAKEIAITNQNNTNGTFRVNALGVAAPASITDVRVAVWSAANGQDDLIWYKMTKNGSDWYADVDTDNHNYVSGNYYAHVYADDSRGVSSLIGASIIAVQNLNANAKIAFTVDSNQENVTVQLKNAVFASSVDKVMFAVWGSSNGQNDLKWYTATKSSSNVWTSSFSIKNHCEAGEYNIHAYTVSRNGSMSLFKAGTTVIKNNTSTGITVSNQNNINGTFRATVTGVSSPATINRVDIAVWSSADGQDDLKWYTLTKSGDNWYGDIDTGNHGYVKGTYNIHAYVLDSRGVYSLVTTKTVSVSNSNANIALNLAANSSQNEFSATLSNAYYQSSVKEILFAVWSSNNGQDDIKWYSGNKLTNSTYQISVPISNHNYDVGTYNVHIYTKSSSGQLSYVTGKTISITGITGNLAISSNNTEQGKVGISISNVSSPATVTQISVAVWSEANGQDDLVWYSASQLSNTWYVYTNAANHNWNEGKYIINVYAYDFRGVSQLLGGLTANVTYSQDYKNSTLKKGIDVSTYQGNIDWTSVKNSGIQYAIIRAGYRGYLSGAIVQDSRFLENARNAQSVGIPYGLYFYSQAVSVAEAVEEANTVINWIRSNNLYISLPIAIDSEYSTTYKTGRADGLNATDRTTITRAFCDTIRAAGYTPMVYASYSWFYDNLILSQLNSYDIWVARYSSNDTGVVVSSLEPNMTKAIWQYSSKGSISGIVGNVDLDLFYKTY